MCILLIAKLFIVTGFVVGFGFKNAMLIASVTGFKSYTAKGPQGRSKRATCGLGSVIVTCLNHRVA